jgi:hypothetical protein
MKRVLIIMVVLAMVGSAPSVFGADFNGDGTEGLISVAVGVK